MSESTLQYKEHRSECSLCNREHEPGLQYWEQGSENTGLSPVYSTGNICLRPAHSKGSMGLSPVYSTGNMGLSPVYNTGNMGLSLVYNTGNMGLSPVYKEHGSESCVQGTQV